MPENVLVLDSLSYFFIISSTSAFTSASEFNAEALSIAVSSLRGVLLSSDKVTSLMLLISEAAVIQRLQTNCIISQPITPISLKYFSAPAWSGTPPRSVVAYSVSMKDALS